jgi:hypothetical protein
VDSENASQINRTKEKEMTKSIDQQAVAVKTRVNAGRDPQSGLPTGLIHGIIAVL